MGSDLKVFPVLSLTSMKSIFVKKFHKEKYARKSDAGHYKVDLSHVIVSHIHHTLNYLKKECIHPSLG